MLDQKCGLAVIGVPDGEGQWRQAVVGPDVQVRTASGEHFQDHEIGIAIPNGILGFEVIEEWRAAFAVLDIHVGLVEQHGEHARLMAPTRQPMEHRATVLIVGFIERGRGLRGQGLDKIGRVDPVFPGGLDEIRLGQRERRANQECDGQNAWRESRSAETNANGERGEKAGRG